MAFVGIGLFFLVFFAAMIAGLVFWIMKIVEVAQIPDPQYRAAGTDKTVWVLVVVLVGWIGALIWQFAKRDDVLRARGLVPPPVGAYGPGPGWGPAPGWGQPPAPGHGRTPIQNPGVPTPAGWYPEPGTGWSAYWDGYRWTGARRPPQPMGQPLGQPLEGQPLGQPGQPSYQPTAPLPDAGPRTGPSLEKRPD